MPAACQQPPSPPPVAASPPARPADTPCEGANTPERAVTSLMEALRRSELERIPCTAVPPALQISLELAWKEGRSTWPLSELPLAPKLPDALEALSKPDARTTLTRGFDSHFAGHTRELREAVRGLGLFGVRYLQKESRYSADDRAHYSALVVALSDWAAEQDLGDPNRGHRAIDTLVTAAQAAGLANRTVLKEAGMTNALKRLDPLALAASQVLKDYGLSVDAMLASVHATRTTLTSADKARVHIQYQAAGKPIETDVEVVNRDGRWYCAELLQRAEKAAQAPFIKQGEIKAEPAPANSSGGRPAAKQPAK